MVVPECRSVLEICLRRLYERVDRKIKAEGTHTSTHPAQNPLWREYHILVDYRILLDHSVDLGNKCSGCPLIRKDTRAHENRTDRCKLIKSFCVEILPAGLFRKLEEPTRKIISDGVSKNVLRGFFWGYVAALARCDENELTLLV